MMLPVVLDLARVPVALVGRDAQALNRLRKLEADGVPRVRVFSDAPSEALRAYGGDRLTLRLPNAADLAGSRIVFIADLPPEDVGDIATAATIAGALVNVEDQRGWCDFHSPSLVRRGDLLIAVSTSGKSPALASRIRVMLEAVFPAVWTERVAELERLRRRLRAHGLGSEVVHATDAVIASRGWLPPLNEDDERRHAHR
ncbi:MAG TPA: NAD(P)-dependent oxidoreductase [Alphaproteobacteria bacterium]|nr:NAD(P)-dependent oxidoreductase [Alphaproteobacteria bacterium]